MKAIIFDCFGVLTLDLWQAFCDGLPPDIDREELRKLNTARDRGLIGVDEFTKKVSLLTGQVPLSLEALPPPEMVKNEQLIAFIGQLRQQNLRIGMLSNVGSNWVRESFLTEQEQKLFDVFVLSYEVGLTKPEPRIFHLACDMLKVEPSEALFVDDIPSYCLAARRLGMQTIVYQDFKQFKTEIEPLLYSK